MHRVVSIARNLTALVLREGFSKGVYLLLSVLKRIPPSEHMLVSNYVGTVSFELHPVEQIMGSA